MARLTGLQRQALSFYRHLHRSCRGQEASRALAIRQHARQEYERYREVDRKNFQLIEHLLRKGKKQLDLATSVNVSRIKL